jgi:FixJ family two-component response regulator
MNVRPTVFLVDDDAQMRLSLKWLLERNGYDVVSRAPGGGWSLSLRGGGGSI